MSELSQISTMNTKQDANKQLAYIRSYLIQLKDEIEAELNNVTYEMLSSDLKKRIDLISDDILHQGDEQDNSYLVVDTLIARYSKITELESDNASLQILSSTLATLQTLNSTIATIQTLNATVSTIQSLTSTVATLIQASISSLSANVITSETITSTGTITSSGDIATASELKADVKISTGGDISADGTVGANKVECNLINASNIKVPGIDISTNSDGKGVITTDHILVSSVNGGESGLKLVGGVSHESGEITVGSVRADSFGIYDGATSGYHNLTLQTSVDADGNSIKVLGYKL